MRFWRLLFLLGVGLAAVAGARAQTLKFIFAPEPVSVREGDFLVFNAIALTVSGSTPIQLHLVLPSRTIPPVAMSSSRVNGVELVTARFGPMIAADSNWYRLTALYTDGSGAASTSTNNITILPALPTITAQPLANVAYAGTNVTLTVQAGGTAPLAYQWRKDGEAIAGATQSTLTLANVQSEVAGMYSVVVTNAAGTVTSTGAFLNVLPASAPVISPLPGAVAQKAGRSISLEGTATGNPPLTYQWRKDGQAIAGATRATWSFAAAVEQAGVYSLVVTNPLGTTTSTEVRVGVAPTFTASEGGGGREVGEALRLATTLVGAPAPTSQWYKDGVAIAGATKAFFEVAELMPGDAGKYAQVATNEHATERIEFDVAVTPVSVGRIVNMSILTTTGTGEKELAVGVGLGGAVAGAPTEGGMGLLVRAAGPTLGSAWGLGGVVSDPVMTLHRDRAQLRQNDDWQGGFDFGAVGAFPFAGTPARDAAIYEAALAQGSYSIQIAGKANGTGRVLAEIYDAVPSAALRRRTPRLINLSARTEVSAENPSVTVGFVVRGLRPVRVLIRAVGPMLGWFGVNGVLSDPKLEIFSGARKIAENDDWHLNPNVSAPVAVMRGIFRSVGAFDLQDDTSSDAAVSLLLEAGEYQAVVTGAGGATGIVLLEVYELP